MTFFDPSLLPNLPQTVYRVLKAYSFITFCPGIMRDQERIHIYLEFNLFKFFFYNAHSLFSDTYLRIFKRIYISQFLVLLLILCPSMEIFYVYLFCSVFLKSAPPSNPYPHTPPPFPNFQFPLFPPSLTPLTLFIDIKDHFLPPSYITRPLSPLHKLSTVTQPTNIYIH